jgi:ketose-bisphosphate aldolase
VNPSKTVQWAKETVTVIPGFNIPYLPMMEPVIKALKDTDSIGMIMVARLELIKFESESLRAIRNEYEKHHDDSHTMLHLDHVPVIDEDNKNVDYESVIAEAMDLGYQSVMIDGSRLSFDKNVEYTKRIVEIAHEKNIPVEAELGAVMGHESGPLPPYNELFESGKGFTDPDEAQEFINRTGTDWLSVAVGNIHGAISKAKKDNEKMKARLDIKHLKKISDKTGLPLVLHGGTGISSSIVREAVKNGIAKINIATAIRQPYERALQNSISAAQEAVYKTMLRIIVDELKIDGNSKKIKNT